MLILQNVFYRSGSITDLRAFLMFFRHTRAVDLHATVPSDLRLNNILVSLSSIVWSVIFSP